MRPRVLVAPLLIALAILMASCARLPAKVDVAPSGVVATLDPRITGFDRIWVEGTFRAVVRRGDEHRVAVYVDQALAPYVQMTKRGRTLRISLEGADPSGLEAPRIEVITPSLANLEVRGSTIASLTGFDNGQSLQVRLADASQLVGEVALEDLWLEGHGSSAIRLAGRAANLTLRGSGSGTVDLAGLSAQDAQVDLSDAVRATVHANGVIDAKVEGAAGLYYLGSPTLGRTRVSGAGRMVPAE